jgi:hypothetical protein
MKIIDLICCVYDRNWHIYQLVNIDRETNEVNVQQNCGTKIVLLVKKHNKKGIFEKLSFLKF